MNLSKVREFILAESTSGPKAAQTFNYPREYDLVVRVDEIKPLDNDEAKKVMTGGRQAEVKISYPTGDSGKKVEKIEPCKMIKISDSALTTFELWVPV